ncbi:MAG: hypothetical protein HY363_00060 [Candidatus Aenigmarchaeota archaeon]|nr:hypothetical protein [Candidatus Aenigmarchaeota archaeon]
MGYPTLSLIRDAFDDKKTREELLAFGLVSLVKDIFGSQEINVPEHLRGNVEGVEAYTIGWLDCHFSMVEWDYYHFKP